MALYLTPASYLTVTAWYKADTIDAVDGAAVGDSGGIYWPDSSGNGHHLYQATAGYRPRFLKQTPFGNKMPAVWFDGTDDYLSTASGGSHDVEDLLGANGLGEVWCVCQPRSGLSSEAGLWSPNDAGGATGSTVRMDQAPPLATAWATNAVDTDSASAQIREEFANASGWGQDNVGQANESYTHGLTQEPVVVVWTFDGTDTLGATINNVKAEAWREVTTAAISNLAHELIIGQNVGRSGSWWDGLIYEIIVADTNQTESNRQKLMAYLCDKYGMWNYTGQENSAEGIGNVPSVKVQIRVPDYSDGPGFSDQGIYLQSPPSLWLKADAITGLANNDSVDSWPDSSGEGWAIESTGAFRPTYKTNQVNGLPAVDFDGGDALNETASPQLQDLFGYDGLGTVYVVAYPTVAGGALFGSLSNAEPSLRLAAGPTIIADDYDSATRSTAGVSTSLSNWHIYCWSHHNGFLATPNNLYVFEDNPEWASGSSVACAASTRMGYELRIGWASGIGFFTGQIAEMLFFRRAHTAPERRYLYSYLAGKYALTYEGDDRGTGIAWPKWVDVSDDLVAGEGIRFATGSTSTAIDERAASSSSLTLALNNRDNNSGGLAGYYSPNHANTRTGWTIGVPLRLMLNWDSGSGGDGANYIRWQGWVRRLSVIPGKAGRNVNVLATDYLDMAAEMQPRALTLQENQKGNDLLWHLCSASTLAGGRPEAAAFEEGDHTFLVAHDTERDEDQRILALMKRLALSDMGRMYLRGSPSTGGRMHYEYFDMRSSSYLDWSTIDLDDDDIFDMSLEDFDLGGLANRIIIEVRPRDVDTSNVVLFTLNDTPYLAAGESITLNCPYRDPTGNATRVGGKDIVTPVSSTDYTANTAEDGTGSNMTASLGVSITKGASSSIVTLTNNHGSTALYVTLFQLRGKGIYTQESVIVEAKDDDSIEAYSGRHLRIDAPVLSQPDRAQVLADWALAQTKDPAVRVRSVMMQPLKNGRLLLAALGRDVGDQVTVTETTSGLSSAKYWIQGVEWDITDGPWFAVRWTLTPFK